MKLLTKLTRLMYLAAAVFIAHSASEAYVARTNAEAVRAMPVEVATVRDFRTVPLPAEKPVAVWWEVAGVEQ
jgi:hypothetical protein